MSKVRNKSKIILPRNATIKELTDSRSILLERMIRCRARDERQTKVNIINLLTFELYKRTYATFEKPDTRLNAFALFRSFGDESCGVPDELEECFIKLKDAFDYIKEEGCLLILGSDEWEYLFNVSDGLTVLKIQRTRVNK